MDHKFDLDVLNGLVSMLKEPFADSFLIKGEPVDHLDQCLALAPKSLQDMIAEEYEIELGSGKKRKTQLEQLKTRILEELPQRLSVFPADKLKLLLEVSTGEASMAEVSGGLSFQTLGWVFYFTDTEYEGVIPSMPNEILDMLRSLLQDKDFMMLFGYYNVYRRYILAFSRLYGVFPRKMILDAIISDFSQEEAMSEAFGKSQDETLEKLAKEEYFYMDSDFIYDADLEEEGDYLERLKRMGDKPYYKPGLEEVKIYHKQYIDPHQKEYKALKRYLAAKLDSPISLEQVMQELSIEAVEELGAIYEVPQILERYELTFASMEDLQHFESLFRAWEDTLRKWNNRGFTNLELKARGEAPSYAPMNWEPGQMQFKDSALPDGDDPCPCGSGKKYRQCCGRKKR